MNYLKDNNAYAAAGKAQPERIFIQPPFDEWQAVLTGNLRERQLHFYSADKILSLRRKIVAAAQRYTNGLAALAREQAIPTSHREPPVRQLDPSTLIITGHQPVIYHMGLLRKNLLLNSFAGSAGVGALNIIIDTDYGDAGAFLAPCLKGDSLLLKRYSLADRQGLLSSQLLPERNQINSIFMEVAYSLEKIGYSAESLRVLRTGELYARFAGRSLVEVNAIIRRCCESDPIYLEVPLSEIVALPESCEFFNLVLSDAEGFFTAYNENLHSFRRKRNIANAANPFPDLGSRDAAIELPFWYIDQIKQERFPVFALTERAYLRLYADAREICVLSREGGRINSGLSCDGGMLAPRAMLISMFLRLLAADLFIHGLGGAKYDACSDDFIRSYFKIEPPSYVVASETRLLFNREAAEVERAKELARSVRDICYHPERYLETGFFDAEQKKIVSDLLNKKQRLVAEIKACRDSGRSAAAVGVQIKRIDAEIQEIVDCAAAPRLKVLTDTPEDLVELYRTREFPYFFFCPELETATG